MEGGVHRAIQQVQQQARRVTDLMTCIRCFMLYTAVMSQKQPELAAPMMAHLHMVIRLHNLGGLTWFHYDWKARRETCARGPAEWSKCDQRQLMCTARSGFVKDPFNLYLRGHLWEKKGVFLLQCQLDLNKPSHNNSLVGVVPVSKEESASYSTGPLLDAHMVTNVSFFISAWSVDAQIMVGGIVQRRQEVQCLEETRAYWGGQYGIYDYC